MEGLLVLSLVFSAMLIYLLPAIIAWRRGHASAGGIFVLNLLLGWSGIVWIIALIWALSNKGQQSHQTVVVNNQINDGPKPPPAPQPIYIPVPQSAAPQPLMHASVSTPLLEADTRHCPMCAETIKAAAIKCRFCGERLVPTLIAPD